MSRLSNLWGHIQKSLFPALEECLEPLSEKQRQFVAVCEMIQLDRHMSPFANLRLGAPKLPRIDFARAFIAKAVYNLPTTLDLIEHLQAAPNLRRLCGWEFASLVPSAATFSRAFAEFAAGDLGELIHEAMVKTHCASRLAGHVSRDSTAICVREKAVKKPKKSKRRRYRRGRPKKGEVREPKPIRLIEVQPTRTLEENLEDLPSVCDWSQKKNSQGKIENWKGGKLHVDVIDGEIPISAIYTSASVHDSQVAIPLAQMSAERVESLYDLMDSAYDAKAIHLFSRQLGHVPIIDPNRRGSAQPRQLAPARAQRYKQRSSAERFNSLLKDGYGGRHIRVRGASKIRLHLMFGVISICATQILRLVQ